MQRDLVETLKRENELLREKIETLEQNISRPQGPVQKSTVSGKIIRLMGRAHSRSTRQQAHPVYGMNLKRYALAMGAALVMAMLMAGTLADPSMESARLIPVQKKNTEVTPVKVLDHPKPLPKKVEEWEPMFPRPVAPPPWIPRSRTHLAEAPAYG